jgi:hypothetical protein
VLRGALDQLVLLLMRQNGQGVGHRRAHNPLVDLALDPGSQAGGQAVTARRPALAAAKQPGRGTQGEAVVADEGVNDPRLVHGGDRPRWVVGAQKLGLQLGGRSGKFDHHRDLGGALLAPPGQSLQAIDDLVRAIGLGYDPDRQLRQVRLGGRR